MNIIATQFTLKTKAFEIYVAGCAGNPHCTGCYNKETWDFNNGEPYNEEFKTKVAEKVKDYDRLIDNIMIFGGEPLDQPKDDIVDLLTFLGTLNKKIWVFSRYDYIEIPTVI